MTATQTQRKVVSKDEWLKARMAHLAAEKEFTRKRDELSRQRRELPWTRVEKNYVFEGPNGPETLSALFEGRSQLMVQHFMFAPGWEEGCKGCSFMADHTDGARVHLEQRDLTLLAVSRAPLADIERFRRRMGWQFKWVSSHGTDFNRDFGVTFAPEARVQGEVYYNYAMRRFPQDEAPGVSVFYKDDAGSVFHTYSTYGRGVEAMIGAYSYLDLAPKGRDEDGLAFSMEWLRHHDKYDPRASHAGLRETGGCCKHEEGAG